LSEAALAEARTKLMGEALTKLGLGSVLFVVAGEPERNFALASLQPADGRAALAGGAPMSTTSSSATSWS
jgi:hypothetical protein